MLFCCLWRNVETSWHKQFVVVSSYQQTPLLTISEKYHNLPRSVSGTVLITSSRSQRSQHALKLDIGWESRFLPAPPAFGGIGRFLGPLRNIAMTFGMKKLERFGYLMVKTFWRYDYSCWQNSRTGRSNYQTGPNRCKSDKIGRTYYYQNQDRFMTYACQNIRKIEPNGR